VNADDRTLAPSHVDLVAMSAAVRQSALDGDRDGLLRALGSLRDVVTEHLLAEAPDFEALPDARRALVEQGHVRLLTLLEDLIAAAVNGADINPLFDTTELDVAVRRQARLEETLLRHAPR
jgi:hypothetical protein